MYRVLIVSGSYPPMRCGVGDYSALLARSLADTKRIHVGVLTGADVNDLGSGIEIVRGPGWRLRAGFKSLQAVSHWNPDLVHIQYPTQGYGGSLLPWFLPLLLKAAGIPVVQTWHEFLPMFSHAHSLLLASACTTAIVVRPKFVESLPWWYRWSTKKIDFNFIKGAASLPHSTISESSRVRLRDDLSRGSERVVTYFGFATRKKGLEYLFRIADPRRDRLILVCDLLESDDYQREILALCDSEAWRGKVTVTGFLPAQEVSDILSASDAVVLPFTDGGGDWNSTVMAVRAQGTLVITTSVKGGGYEEASNTFYSKPGDLEAMANAIALYGGRKSDLSDTVTDTWSEIAELHVKIYERILSKKSEAVT